MNLRPLGDRIVLKYLEAEEKTQTGIILSNSAKKNPQIATVIAVGTEKGTDGITCEIQVKEGDKVILSKYSGTEFKVDDEEYVVVSQKDIIAVIE